MEFDVIRSRTFGTVSVSLEYGNEALEAWFNDELTDSNALVNKLKEIIGSPPKVFEHIQGRAFSLFINEQEIIVVHHQLLTSTFLSELLGEAASYVVAHHDECVLPDDTLSLDEDSLHAACGFDDFIPLFKSWLEEVEFNPR